MRITHPEVRRAGAPGKWPPAVRALCHRLLDGVHPWGFFDAMVGRYGLRRYRLVVFPPGIGAGDRRLLRLWRGWQTGGGLLALLAVMLLSDAVSSSATTLLVAAATYVGVGAVLFVMTADVRPRVRSMSVILLTGDLDGSERRRFEEWEKLVCVLTAADRLLNAGRIAPVQHEALWWQAYERMEIPAHV